MPTVIAINATGRWQAPPGEEAKQAGSRDRLSIHTRGTDRLIARPERPALPITAEKVVELV